jgi:class I fructose-bisphosphate aldolase/fructose-bisphosphate aldolase/2-amino-3,7-dideoxy-D-threo-hept-6-ulosonate synthase
MVELNQENKEFEQHMLGKEIRIDRMKNAESGRIFTVAVDHAPSYGVLDGIEDIQSVVDRVASAGPDAMVMMKGIAQHCFQPYAGQVALIMKCSSLSPYHPQHDVWVSTVDDAVRLGADAIAMAMTVGCSHQQQLMSNLGALACEAEQVGMPVIVHAYPNGELVPPDEVFTVERVGYASRMAMELGVDIVKTFYTGSTETFAQVVEMASPALVVAAGGPRLETDADVLRMVRDVARAGAAGITFGRNIWQSTNPGALIQALKHVLHHGGSVEEGLELLAR